MRKKTLCRRQAFRKAQKGRKKGTRRQIGGTVVFKFNVIEQTTNKVSTDEILLTIGDTKAFIPKEFFINLAKWNRAHYDRTGKYVSFYLTVPSSSNLLIAGNKTGNIYFNRFTCLIVDDHIKMIVLNETTNQNVIFDRSTDDIFIIGISPYPRLVSASQAPAKPTPAYSGAAAPGGVSATVAPKPTPAYSGAAAPGGVSATVALKPTPAYSGAAAPGGVSATVAPTPPAPVSSVFSAPGFTWTPAQSAYTGAAATLSGYASAMTGSWEKSDPVDPILTTGAWAKHVPVATPYTMANYAGAPSYNAPKAVVKMPVVKQPASNYIPFRRYVISSHGRPSKTRYSPPKGAELHFFTPDGKILKCPNVLQTQVCAGRRDNRVVEVISNRDVTLDYLLSKDLDASWKSGAVDCSTKPKKTVIFNLEVYDKPDSKVHLSYVVKQIMEYHETYYPGELAKIFCLFCRGGSGDQNVVPVGYN